MATNADEPNTSGTNVKRNTTVRDKHRTQIARTQPPCGICGQAIDYGLPYLHPRSYVVDHIVPLTNGGPDTLGNKQAAHRDCNRAKGAREHADIMKRSGSLVRPGGGGTPRA
jgi:5-methylcytosine-specific restriction endonuclease McrA